VLGVSAALLALAQTSAAQAPAGPAAQPATTAPSLHIPLQRVTLRNGLRVVLNVDATSPTVAVCVTYNVGSRNEQPGRSGFAHLFEHMMFQGSANVAKGDHFKLITERGGTLNGTTSADRTNYFEILPKNGLATALWLEADRMKSLDISAENFENQRNVVQEEYRMRVSNGPYVTGLFRLHSLAFDSYFPYGHSTIGEMKDLETAELGWVRAFHGSYYGPNNAVLSIAGDFEPRAALELVEKYFGSAAPVQVAPYAPPAEVPLQAAARQATIEDGNVRTRGLYQGWVIGPSRTDDHYALEVASVILGSGETSRLYQTLVRDRSWAQDVNVWTDDNRGPDMFAIQV
jgi:zinc protease